MTKEDFWRKWMPCDHPPIEPDAGTKAEFMADLQSLAPKASPPEACEYLRQIGEHKIADLIEELCSHVPSFAAPEAASGRDAEFMAWARRHAPTQLAELITRREQMRSQTGKDHSQPQQGSE